MRVKSKGRVPRPFNIILCSPLNFQPSTLNSKQPVLLEAEVRRGSGPLAADDDVIKQVNLQ